MSHNSQTLNHHEHKLDLHIAHCYQYYIAMHKDKKLKSQRTLITKGFFFLDADDGFSFPQFLGFESFWQIFPNFSNYTFFKKIPKIFPKNCHHNTKICPQKNVDANDLWPIAIFLLCIIKIKTLICITMK